MYRKKEKEISYGELKKSSWQLDRIYVIIDISKETEFEIQFSFFALGSLRKNFHFWTLPENSIFDFGFWTGREAQKKERG
jgi:hypothetical protein